MEVTKGFKLSEIKKENVAEVNYSNKENLIFKFKANEEWYFVFDNNGNKIQKNRTTVLMKEVLGNPDVLNYLLDMLPSGETNTK
jgi:hypothetical protein